MGIIGMKWGTRKEETFTVTESLDSLTQQLLLANKMNAADILHRQDALTTEDYHEFLFEVLQQ